MELREVADGLYGGLPTDFTPGRTAAEKQAKAEGDRDLAAAVKALRKPSVGAWAVNLLVRWEAEQIDQVLALAESLRTAAAALDGTELRALTRQRRQLTAALTTRARQLALEHGQRLTGPVADQVEATLTAAMLDEGVADAVRTGLLVTTVAATGLDQVDLAGVVAVPEALGTRAPSPEAAATALHAVPDNAKIRREAARDRLAEARTAADRATRTREKAGRAYDELSAEQLRVQGDLDELQRRIAALESRLDSLDDELEEAEAARDLAAEEEAEAHAARDRAQRELDAFDAPQKTR